MANFYDDNDDLQFYVDKVIDWEKIVRLTERGYKSPDAPANWEEALETYKDVLRLVGKLTAEEIAPKAEVMDRKGLRFEDGKVVASDEHEALFEQLKEVGLYGMTMPRELGGMNMPTLLYMLSSEIFARADVSTMTHFGFHAATAVSLLLYSINEGTTEFDENGNIVSTRFQKEIEKVLAGETWGTMDLTEPDAGSDLAALRTRAVQDEQGVWRVTGNKIFITSGHGNYHLVLAKTRNEDSLKALSMFMVPLELDKDGETVRNAYVDRIEEKIGHHASATCSVQFDASEGYLIGKEGAGFKQMLMLMNHARLGVGFESIGLCEAAYRSAKEYAAERRTMGQAIDQHPMIADYLDEMDVTIRGLRAMAMKALELDEEATRLELEEKARGDKVVDVEARKRRKKIERRVRDLTPLIKYASSEAAVWMARMAMQIHGGNGYTKDYPPERLLRDALVLPVYEGTSQIQALMALKDNLQSALKNPQKFLRKLAAAKLTSVRSTDSLERDLWKLKSASYQAQQHILLRIAKDKWSEAIAGPLTGFLDAFKTWDPKRDFAYGLLHAESLTQILSDVAQAQALVEQAQAFPERRDIAERFVERVTPRVHANLEKISSTGDRLLNRLAQQSPEAQSEESA